MVKKEYRILIKILLLFIAGQLNAQQFDFESDKKQTSQYNQKIAESLDKNDIKKIKKLLNKKPSLVNSSSRMTNTSKYSVLTGGNIPLLYDAVNRCLNSKCSVEMVKTILNYNPNMYCTYDDLTPFYLILNFIATNTIASSVIANKLFAIFANQPNFKINQKYKDLPPPMSFLLSMNYDFLGKTYNNEYISSDIILTFVQRGVSLNTRDINSNSVFSFAIISEDSELINYCIKEGADVTIKNKDGQDALYYAIKNNNYKNVVAILNANYPLSENSLVKMGICNVLQFSNDNIQNVLFDKLKNGIKDLENMKNLFKLFPDKKKYFISKEYERAKYNISSKEIPSFIALFNDVPIENNAIALKNIETLINEYKKHVILNANKTGNLIVLIKIKKNYGLNANDYTLINEREFLKKTKNIYSYEKIFPKNISGFTNRCVLNAYYDGPIVNGYANGTGTALTEIGLFIGDFINGIPNGKINIRYANGNIFKGYFAKGVYNGYGSLYANGYKYVGEFVNGLFDGAGDDGNYKGSWHKGKRHGYGNLQHTESSLFGLLNQTYSDYVYYENGVLIRNFGAEERERLAEQYHQEENEAVVARKDYQDSEWEEMPVDIIDAMFDVKSKGQMKEVWIKCPSSSFKRKTKIYYSYSRSKYYVSADWLSNKYFDSYEKALKYALEKLDCH